MKKVAGQQPRAKEGIKSSLPKRRVPRTAAIAIQGVEKPFSYGSSALKNLREKIALADLDITTSHIRKSASGGIVIEIPGKDRMNKAEKLKDKVAEVLGSTTRVSRPCIKGELRLIGLDDSVVAEEIADVVAAAGDCRTEDVKVGTIRAMTNGLFSAWVQCSLGAAVKASQSGKVKIGWTIVKVELLKARPTLCYRCWNRGHVKAQCRSPINRSRTCYRCGVEGHTAIGCSAPLLCAPCRDSGREHEHRVGASECVVVNGLDGGAAPPPKGKQTPMDEEITARRAATMSCDDA